MAKRLVDTWISVDDQLPKADTIVLVYANDIIKGHCVAHYSSDGCFRDGTVVPLDVTHWMPLPAPPEVTP